MTFCLGHGENTSRFRKLMASRKLRFRPGLISYFACRLVVECTIGFNLIFFDKINCSD